MSQNLNIIAVIKEAVAAEFKQMMEPFVRSLEQDLSSAFNQFNDKLNDLNARLEKLETPSELPAKEGTSEVEL